MRRIVHILCWLLPHSSFKYSLLRRFGHHIGKDVAIGPQLVLGCGRLEIGDGSYIQPFNVFKGLSLFRMDGECQMNSFNWISAATEFQELDPKAGTMHMGFGAGVRSRNYLDCSGTIIAGPYSAIGGQRVFLQSHEPDFVKDSQQAKRIVIGHHSILGSGTMMLGGSILPDESVLAANSTMLPAKPGDDLKKGVYVGSPAKWKAETNGVWFSRRNHVMSGNMIVGEMGPVTFDPAINCR